MNVQEMMAPRPEKIRQKVLVPRKQDGNIQTKKAVCHFDYYIKDSEGKGLPRLYLCDHRTLADIFLESALFDPRKNVLCIPKTEWENTPEDAKKALRKFEKICKEPYQSSQAFLRQLFRARDGAKSILLPVTEDARGMDLAPLLDSRGIARLCRMLKMPVCTVTFREEPEANSGSPGENEEEIQAFRTPGTAKKSGQNSFFLDVKPLFAAKELEALPAGEPEKVISEMFQAEPVSEAEKSRKKRKRLMMRAFLQSELHVEITAEIYQGRFPSDAAIFRADMTGVTLEVGKAHYHRGPGALKSLAVYPGKTEVGESGTILVYPYHEKTFYLFTQQDEDAKRIQAAVEQMYEIVLEQQAQF